MYKTPQPRNVFGSWDVEQVHAVVARSTFRSQNAKNTTCPRDFWMLKCRVVWQARGILHPGKKWAKREGYKCLTTTTTTLQFTQRYTTRITLHYATTTTATATRTTTTVRYTRLRYSYNYTTLHYTTLDYATLYHTTVHNTTVHYTNYTHYTTLHYTTLVTPHRNCNFHCNCNCNYATLITLHYNYNSTTLHHNYNYNYNCTTPHYIQQLWWGDRCNHCNHCNHSKKNTTPTTFRSMSGFALSSVIHNNQPLL